MKISICVGSSCHLKGSRDVVIRLQELIAENMLDADVELSASFCMGNCAKGVSVTIDDTLIDYVTPETVDEVFNEKVLKVIKNN